MQQFLAPPKPRYALLPLTRLPTANDGHMTASITYKRKLDNEDEGEMDEEDEVDDEKEEIEKEWDSGLRERKKKKRTHSRKFRKTKSLTKELTISEAIHEQRAASQRREANATKMNEIGGAAPVTQPIEKPRTFVLVPPGPPDIISLVNSGSEGNDNKSNDINSHAIRTTETKGTTEVNSNTNNPSDINNVGINIRDIIVNTSEDITLNEKRSVYPDGWCPLPPLVIHGSQRQLPRVYNVSRERIYYELYPYIYDLFACKCASDRNFMLHEVLDRLSEPDLIVLPSAGTTPPHPCIMVSANGMSRLCSSVQRFSEIPSVVVTVSIVSNIESHETISSLLRQGASMNPSMTAMGLSWARAMQSSRPSPLLPPLRSPPVVAVAPNSTPPLQLPPLLPPPITMAKSGSGSAALPILSECSFLCSNLKRRMSELSLPGRSCSFPPAKLLAAECSSQVAQIATLLEKLSADVKILQNFEEYGNSSSSSSSLPNGFQFQRPLPAVPSKDKMLDSQQQQQMIQETIQKPKKKRGRPPLNPNVVGGISLAQINTNK